MSRDGWEKISLCLLLRIKINPVLYCRAELDTPLGKEKKNSFSRQGVIFLFDIFAWLVQEAITPTKIMKIKIVYYNN